MEAFLAEAQAEVEKILIRDLLKKYKMVKLILFVLI